MLVVIDIEHVPTQTPQNKKNQKQKQNKTSRNQGWIQDLAKGRGHKFLSIFVDEAQ